MSNRASAKAIDPKNKEVWLVCGSCNKETAHRVLAEVDEHDTSPDGDVEVWKDYCVVQCQGCKTISFFEVSRCSEDFDVDASGEMILTETHILYPSRLAGRALLEDMYVLPHGVANIYQQTHRALCDKLTILAGIGLRTIVEAVCSERNASGDNLFDMIQDLVRQGIVTKDGADILHSIRLLGNKAAHEIKANEEDELYAAFEVVEHLLKAVYTIPRKAKKLQAKEKKMPGTNEGDT